MFWRLCKYVWVFPNTFLGLLFMPIAWLDRGSVRFVDGAIEIQSPVVALFLKRCLRGRTIAITLGHVILGCNARCLDSCRQHEHVHIRQYETWGPFFLPAYMLASLWALLQGLDPYRDNAFEREAYGQEE